MVWSIVLINYDNLFSFVISQNPFVWFCLFFMVRRLACLKYLTFVYWKLRWRLTKIFPFLSFPMLFRLLSVFFVAPCFSSHRLFMARKIPGHHRTSVLSWGLDASVIKIEFTQAFLVSIVSRNGNLGSVFNTYTLNKAAIENVQFFFHLCVHESKNANYLTCGRLKRCAFQHISFALQMANVW